MKVSSGDSLGCLESAWQTLPNNLIYHSFLVTFLQLAIPTPETPTPFLVSSPQGATLGENGVCARPGSHRPLECPLLLCDLLHLPAHLK